MPMMLAFGAVRAMRGYHSATTFARPVQLRKVYIARILAYGAAGLFLGSAPPTYSR